jgi:hypothetical protein
VDAQKQKDLILKFFERDINTDRYPGWKGIAENLINHGGCIVPGDKCIWQGGIGNFIKLSEPEIAAIGCLMYKFDAQYFLTSEMYKYAKEYRLQEIKASLKKHEDRIEELKKETLEL